MSPPPPSPCFSYVPVSHAQGHLKMLGMCPRQTCACQFEEGSLHVTGQLPDSFLFFTTLPSAGTTHGSRKKTSWTRACSSRFSTGEKLRAHRWTTDQASQPRLQPRPYKGMGGGALQQRNPSPCNPQTHTLTHTYTLLRHRSRRGCDIVYLRN